MKKQNWFILMFILLLSMMFVVGCPEDDSGDGNPAGPTGDLSAGDMTDEQIIEATEHGMVGSAQMNVSTATGMKAAFISGAPGPDLVFPKGLEEFPEIADPPVGWDGPDNDGWYTQTDMQYYDVFKVRLTPDMWAGDPGPLTKLEYYGEYSFAENGAQFSLIWDYWGQTNNDRTACDGSFTYSYIYDYEVNGQQLGYTYDWDMSWTGVSLVEGDYSGHFESSMLYPIYTMEGFQMVAMTTTLDFNADATGSGTGAIAGEDYVHFTFTGLNEFNQIAGYYTLKSENWEIEHDIAFY